MKTKMDWSAPARGIPPDASLFGISARTTLFFLGAMLLALVEAALLFVHAWFTADPTTRITQIPEGVFFALVAELNWRFLRRSRVRIAVNSEGIWRRQGGKTDFLAWSNLAGVRANDAQQYLELTDNRGLASMRVDYQIGNFERLRDYILDHSAGPAQLQPPGTSVFHHSSGYRTIYAAVAAILFFVAWRLQHHAGHPLALVPLVLGVVLVFMVLREPTTVVIGHDGLAIRHWGFQRDILFNSISAIDLSNVRYRGNVWAGVRITLRSGARIRLSRFREGSVTLYEALRAAWTSNADAHGAFLSPSSAQPVADGAREPAPKAPSPPLPAPRTRSLAVRGVGVAFAAIVLTALAMIAGLGRTQAVRAPTEAAASRSPSQLRSPLNPRPVAQLSQLKGSGAVYLVQMGDHTHPYSLADFAQWLHGKYAIDVQILPAMPIDPSAWDARRRQFVAEQLFAQIKQRYPDLARDRNAFLIGFMDGDMYSADTMWSSTFTQRDHRRAAIISSAYLGDTAWQRAHLSAASAVDRFRDRLRRILLKDVAVLYWHLPLNNDPGSLLHDPLNPDLPVDDIYASDLDPALSPAGARVDEPCVYFTYSDEGGFALLPGPVVRGCSDIQDPMEDESVELLEVDLRLGLLIDKHTDLDLPDTIPIRFQRAIRDGGYGQLPFGVSGGDNYDELLGSADNIHVFMESGDGTRIDMIRVPAWLPFLPLVKYVGGEEARAWVPGALGRSYQLVWQYQMAWHTLPFEQYDLQRFNGGTKTFLPCGSVPGLDCVLVDYHDSQGRELRIDRDSLRRLTRITSPHGSWIGVTTDKDGRILNLHDSRGRTVLYDYDAAHNLASVTYPSGEIYHYTYDDTQHILSVAVSADAHSDPRPVVRNEYRNKMLTKMTLPDGSAFTFNYDSTNRMTVHHATIHTPDGRIFTLAIGDPWTIVHEIPASSAAPHP
jgi:YD repeat-containing protein